MGGGGGGGGGAKGSSIITPSLPESYYSLSHFFHAVNYCFLSLLLNVKTIHTFSNIA